MGPTTAPPLADDKENQPGQVDLQKGVQENIRAVNVIDEDGNPTGGTVNLRIGERNPLRIQWQDGPRGKDADGNLAPANGAFVEDVIWAAKQRLEFFQDSKYSHQNNQDAIQLLDSALGYLAQRRRERADRGVEGQHEV